uniref:Uncharacterized protein n=1 Tax=Rhizophora mucronata TaxID=61149 RepID=A0A2P2KKX2_RHIMU
MQSSPILCPPENEMQKPRLEIKPKTHLTIANLRYARLISSLEDSELTPRML